MDATLVINPGSSSKKYALFKAGVKVLTVTFERTGGGYEKCAEVNGVRNTCEAIEAHAYGASLAEVLRVALREGAIADIREIRRVGVRVVSPGTFFATHRPINTRYMHMLEAMEEAAPLHIPPICAEVRAVARLLPAATSIGISDSAFHTTMPEHTRLYSIPREDAQAFDMYRFGYHGISVGSIVHAFESVHGAFPKRAIVCHVGSGVSVTALRDGKSFDTTMGFSPTSGLMMNSRAGDIDAGALLYLMKKKNLGVSEAEIYVSERGGFCGLVGSADLRVALDLMARGDIGATHAVTLFAQHIKKAIGAFVAELGGLDMIILTGTAVERNATVRAHILAGLAGIGITLDDVRNEAVTHGEGVLSTDASVASARVMRTDELGEIARIAESVAVS